MTLSRRASTALSIVSASRPASAENRMKGATNVAPASAVRAAGSSPDAAPIRYAMRRAMACLKKLSLHPPRNCVQNSGAKRGDVIKLRGFGVVIELSFQALGGLAFPVGGSRLGLGRGPCGA